MAEGRKAASLAAWIQRGQQEGSETQGICVVQGSEAGSGGRQVTWVSQGRVGGKSLQLSQGMWRDFSSKIKVFRCCYLLF